MTPLDSDSGLRLYASIPNLDVFLDEAINYLPTAGFFLVGIWIGYLFFGRRKSGNAAGSELESSPAGESREPESPDGLLQREVSRLGGELQAARILGEQQKNELASMHQEIALTRRNLSEKQDRVVELSRTIESALTQSGNQCTLAQVRAPVIHLAEVLQMERQRIGSAIGRLKRLENRLEAHASQLEACAGEIVALRGQLQGKPDPRVKELKRRIGPVDESLRVLMQNVSGCLQRITAAGAHLDSERKKLDEAGESITGIESALAALASGETPEPEEIGGVVAGASAKLTVARASIAALNNGIDQEIAEMTGRIDWVVEDSPQKFFKAFDPLNAGNLPDDPGLAMMVNKIVGRLAGIKGSLEGARLALQTDAALETPAGGCGKAELEEALGGAAAALEAGGKLQAAETADRSEADGALAHLQRQLALREAETARLHGELKSRDEDLKKLEVSLEKRKKKAGEKTARRTDQASNRGFVRRLLGLGPGRGSDPGGESEGSPVGAPPAATLAEARAILNELKVSTSSGNGGSLAVAAAGVVESVPASRSMSPVVDEPELEPDPETAAEVVRLCDRLSGQQDRIRELEREVADFREAEKSRLEIAAVEAREPRPRIRLLTGIQPGESIEPENETVIFRGHDLANWNSEFSDSDERLAMPLERVPESVRYLRMRRLDTGDSVVIPITRDELLAGASATGKGFGWSGKRERYFGGYHFGIYDESLPREVETKFGVGGWGFGHRASIDSEQAYGWAGNRIEPTDFEISVGCGAATEPVENAEIEPEGQPEPEPESEAIVGEAGLVIFRSNDPEMWNQTIYHGANCRSRAIRELPDDVCWLRIRRLPEENSVIVPITKASLTNDGEGLTYGFNGANEIFYGARHLGAFAENLPQEVETRFTYGGWGFGHRPAGLEEQACGWEGREAPRDSVFEFTVYRQKPDVYEPFDRVLGEPR